jgi:hypothetical protein
VESDPPEITTTIQVQQTNRTSITSHTNTNSNTTNTRNEPLLSSTAPSCKNSTSTSNPFDDASRTPSGMTEAASETNITSSYAMLAPNVDVVDISKPTMEQEQQPWYNTKAGLGVALLIMLGVVSTVSAAAFLVENRVNHKHQNVAFVGNSNFFVNDLPRLMEAVADGKIFQDSCLHSKGSIMNIIMTGNGMYQRWQTEAAVLDNDYTQDDYQYANDDPLYDYGACSVPQLLIGQDAYLSIGGYDDQDDETNPCLQSAGYLEYTESFNYSAPWDFVVVTDQSKRMCYAEAREQAILALNYTYIPILQHTGGIPIIVQPHGFWSESVNMTGLGDVPTFTAKIYNGALEYVEFMERRMSDVRLAPVGMAFLAVYDQDKDLWSKLFLSDGIHPSPSGTFLYASVIYATIYGHMPKSRVVILDDMSKLWSKARKLQSNEFPEKKEAEYLMAIAKKVTLKGFLPDSLPTINSTEYYDEDYEDEDEDEDDWGGDYDGWYDYSNEVSWNNSKYSSNYQNGDYNANADGEYAN